VAPVKVRDVEFAVECSDKLRGNRTRTLSFVNTRHIIKYDPEPVQSISDARWSLSNKYSQPR